jgi:hypothetical protein
MTSKELHKLSKMSSRDIYRTYEYGDLNRMHDILVARTRNKDNGLLDHDLLTHVRGLLEDAMMTNLYKELEL